MLQATGVLVPAALLLGLLGVLGCQPAAEGGAAAPSAVSLAQAAAHPVPRDPLPKDAAGPRSVPSTVSVTHPVPVQADEGYPSSLYVERDVRVPARRTGVIEKILVDRGRKVRAGEALAVLETDLATRELEMAEQQLRLAQADYDRLVSLHEARIVSPQEFQRVEIARDLATTKVALARAQLDRCTVLAPFDGVVVERWAVLGQRVEEDDGTPLFRVAARDPLRARIDVPEDRAEELRVGDKAFLKGSGGGESLRAKVVFVAPARDPASGTVPVIVEVLERAAPLVLGSSVRVHLEKNPTHGAGTFSLPHEALLDPSALDGDQATVLVVLGGRAVSRQVQVVRVEGQSVAVTGEIAPADSVIISAEGVLADGDPVVVREGP